MVVVVVVVDHTIGLEETLGFLKSYGSHTGVLQQSW